MFDGDELGIFVGFGGCGSGIGGIFAEIVMGAVVVVIINVLLDQGVQVVLVDDDDVIQEFSTD